MSDVVRPAGSPPPPSGGASFDDERPLDPPPSLFELFWVFSKIGILSFGGALTTWVHREISVKRHWMTEIDVLSGLALSQIMPGINVVNLALFCGQRLRGVAGSFVCVMGILAAPTVLVIGISTVYDQFAEFAWLGDLLNGIAAAAIGMLIHMGVKATQRSARSLPLFLIVVGIFVGVGVMKWHMVIVVAVLAPISVWLSYRALAAEQRARAETPHG
jgi:chromate transporter